MIDNIPYITKDVQMAGQCQYELTSETSQGWHNEIDYNNRLVQVG